MCCCLGQNLRLLYLLNIYLNIMCCPHTHHGTEVSWPKDHRYSHYSSAECWLTRYRHYNHCIKVQWTTGRDAQLHSTIHSLSCCSQYYFILSTTICATYKCPHARAHIDRLSICVEWLTSSTWSRAKPFSPPPPSSVWALHFTHSSSTMEAFQSFKLAVITAKGIEWEWQHVTLHTQEHLIHWFYIEHAAFQKGSWEEINKLSRPSLFCHADFQDKGWKQGWEASFIMSSAKTAFSPQPWHVRGSASVAPAAVVT